MKETENLVNKLKKCSKFVLWIVPPRKKTNKQIQLEEEAYSRSPQFSLSDSAHHILHLDFPLVVHNLLPHPVAIGNEAQSLSRIGSGREVYLSHTSLAHSQKFLLEVKPK